jgi:hypothetical protein
MILFPFPSNQATAGDYGADPQDLPGLSSSDSELFYIECQQKLSKKIMKNRAHLSRKFTHTSIRIPRYFAIQSFNFQLVTAPQ